MIEVITPPQSHDGIDGQIGKVVFFVGDEFGTEGGAGYAKEIVAKGGFVLTVVDGGGFEGRSGGGAGETPSLGYGLGVDSLGYEVFGFSSVWMMGKEVSTIIANLI